MRVHRLIITSALLLLGGCGSRAPLTYDLPLPAALDRLEHADIDGFRSARQCGILIHFSSNRGDDNTVAWQVTSDGDMVLRFSVRLEAETGSQTRAVIEIPAGPKHGEAYDGTQQYTRPALNQPLRPALKELVDAAMEQRPYDAARLPDGSHSDSVCNVQRAGLEATGKPFHRSDIPGMDSEQSAAERNRVDAEDTAAQSKPDNRP